MLEYFLITSCVVMVLFFIVTIASVVIFVSMNIFTVESNRFVTWSFCLGCLFMFISFALFLLKLAYD